jgi:hypothetical protein
LSFVTHEMRWGQNVLPLFWKRFPCPFYYVLLDQNSAVAQSLQSLLASAFEERIAYLVRGRRYDEAKARRSMLEHLRQGFEHLQKEDLARYVSPSPSGRMETSVLPNS